MGTLWYGGKVRTLVNENDVKEAVFVENGIIQAVGTKDELERIYQNNIDRYENINGAVMYPGFIDSHIHMIGHGERLLQLDLSEVESFNELKEILEKEHRKLPKDTWLIGEGFNENLFPDKKIPDRSFLDTISTERPIMLKRICRHAVVTNSRGLQLANIDKNTRDPDGGVIVKDDTGKPTGLLLDEAKNLLERVIPSEDFAKVKKSLEVSLNDMYAHGVVGAHTEDLNYYGDPLKTLQTFYDVIDGREKKFRTNILIHHEVLQNILQEVKIDHSFVKLGAVKIFADGALGGRTALLSEPYTDDPTTNGVAIHSKEQLAHIVKTAREYEMPVAIHVIGDLALQYAIEAIERYPVKKGLRDRLIHLQVTRKDLLERLKQLPVVLDIQPRFVASDFPWVIERIGTDRLTYAYAWKKLLNEGFDCAGGSDSPIEKMDPLLGIHAAVTRKSSIDGQCYGAEEKLSLFEALRLFTYGSASAIGEEKVQGLIKKGYRADFTIFDRDLFELENDELLQAEVVKTVVDDTIMYEK